MTEEREEHLARWLERLEEKIDGTVSRREFERAIGLLCALLSTVAGGLIAVALRQP